MVRQKNILKSDFVIIGTGAGGATIARELALNGKDVLMLEKGCYTPSSCGVLNEVATIDTRDHLERALYKLKQVVFSREKISVSYRIGIGGTTVCASGNMVRSLERELEEMGIDLSNEFDQLEQELNIRPFPETHMGRGALILKKAADESGYHFHPIPKCIDFSKCNNCGNCYEDCLLQAKWTALEYIDQARQKQARLLDGIHVKELMVHNGVATGVKAYHGKTELEIEANTIVLAAGGIATPLMLQNAGMRDAGRKLFCHPCYCVYGSSQDGYLHKNESSPLILSRSGNRGGYSLYSKIVKVDAIENQGYLGINIKIKDDHFGSVHNDGRVFKMMSSEDLKKKASAVAAAREILIKAGIDYRTIRVKGIGSFHPGGTAAIGNIVDKNLQTEIKNLYISDASVLPAASGLPPLLTIMALAKRLGNYLCKTQADVAMEPMTQCG